MVNPDDIDRELQQHFDGLDAESFLERIAAAEGDSVSNKPSQVEANLEVGHSRELRSLPTEASPLIPLPAPSRVTLPLNAYLACALTGLDSNSYALIALLSDTIAQVCAGVEISLYEPRKKTDPNFHPNVADSEVFQTDRDRVVTSDLVIYLSHFPSTGAGEELDIAYNAMVPILVIKHSSTRVSRMVTGIPGLVRTTSYDEPEELREVLTHELERLRPLLEQRKLAFGDYEGSIVGSRIRRLREEQMLTREQLADAASSTSAPMTPELIRHIEESSDRQANPSLIQLRELASSLKTTVADLVEPDLEAVILNRLSDWASGSQAARGTQTGRDRRRLLKRVLLRVVDSLEQDD